MDTYTLEQVIDELVGLVGTPNRDLFEYEFQMELVDQIINPEQKEYKFTQKN